MKIGTSGPWRHVFFLTHMVCAHVEAFQRYKNNPLSTSWGCGFEGLQWIKAVYIHPSIPACWAVRLQWSVQTTKQNLHSSLWSHLLVVVLFYCGVKEGIIMLKKISNFSLNELFRTQDKSMLCSWIQFCRTFYPVFNCLLTLHWLVPALPRTGQEPPQVGGLIYYNLQFVTHFSNVENCKTNPENPSLRWVSCFSNTNKRGPK